MTGSGGHGWQMVVDSLGQKKEKKILEAEPYQSEGSLISGSILPSTFQKFIPIPKLGPNTDHIFEPRSAFDSSDSALSKATDEEKLSLLNNTLYKFDTFDCIT